MNDQIEIKDLDQEIPLQEDWLVFQKDSNRIVYKAPKSDIEGEDAFVYIGYADDDIGTGFTLTFDPSKDYIAFKGTNVEIPNPVASDFAGLWKKYKGETGDKGDAATIQVGTVTTVDSRDPATVVNSGDEHSAVFNFEIPQGEKGKGIVSIDKTGTVGLIDTYTITYDDGTTTTFDVTNGDKGNTGDAGRGIVSIEKTNTVGLVDTYTIRYTDSTTSTFDVTNGAKGDKGDKGDIGPQGIQGIQGIQGNPGTNGIDGTNGISFTPKGAYNALTEYVANDVVSYLGSTWIALQTTTGNTPSESVYWTLNAAKGTDGEGSGDMLASVYDPAGGAKQVAFLDQLPDITTKWTKGGDNIGAKKLLGSIDNQPIGLITNNLERLTILEDGNVGIGTTSPAVDFTIKQGTSEYAQLSTPFDMALGIASNSTKITGLDFKNFEATGQTRLMARNNADDYIAMNAMGTTSPATFFGQAGNQMLLFSNGSRMAVGTFDSQPLILGTDNTERMRITSGGNVGIGTTTPTASLHIKAGTATAGTAPLKLTSGTLNTTAEAGAIEFLTDRYYATITTGAERKTLAFTSDIVSQVEDDIVDGHTTVAPSGNAVFDALDAKASLTGTETLTNKRITPRVTTITSHATPTINTDNCDAVTITAQAEAITSMTTNLSGTPTNFQKLIIRIKDNGTARAITWGDSFEAKGVALPTTTVISKVLTVGFIYDTVTSKWGCVASSQEA